MKKKTQTTTTTPKRNILTPPRHYTLPPAILDQLQEWNQQIEDNREREGFRGPRFGLSRVLAGVVRWAQHHSIDLGTACTVDDIATAPQRKREKAESVDGI
jgi:hypothetical protein